MILDYGPTNHNVLANGLMNISTKTDFVLFKMSKSMLKPNSLKSFLILKLDPIFSLNSCFQRSNPDDNFRAWSFWEPKYLCHAIDRIKTCVQDLHPTCIGFVKKQFPLFVTSIKEIRKNRDKDYTDDARCVTDFEQSQEPPQKVEFPAFNQLVDELVLIKAILNNRPN